MFRFTTAIVLLALITTVATAQDKIDAKLLIGKWEPNGEDTKGAKIVLEFTDKGEMLVNAEYGGQKSELKGTYKLEGDKLDIKLKNPAGKESGTSLKVVKLTNEELITKEADKKEEKMKRVK